MTSTNLVHQSPIVALYLGSFFLTLGTGVTDQVWILIILTTLALGLQCLGAYYWVFNKSRNKWFTLLGLAGLIGVIILWRLRDKSQVGLDKAGIR